jgi:hypothetical protein
MLTFLVINGMQERAMQARGPVALTGVQYAGLPPASVAWMPEDALAGNYPAR